MSRWSRHRQKLEPCYESKADTVDVELDKSKADAVDVDFDHSTGTMCQAQDLHSHVPDSVSQRHRWKRKDETQSSNASSVLIGKHERKDSLFEPSEILRKGVSEMEVAAGYDVLSTANMDILQWPKEVGGAPVKEEPSLRPIDVKQMIKGLESSLGFKGTQLARKDQHARRKPIPCGVPLLTGHACNYACQYCYLQDWFPFARPTPTPLTGQEVLLSLLYNPYWIPSRDFIILGDACDPFHPDLEARTMEYVEAVAPLQSPIQFSTKSAISETTASNLACIASTHRCSISVLVTITTIKNARSVEPIAPSVDERLGTIRRISGAGLCVFAFMRPLLPGASEDYADVLLAAKEAGALGVIVGSLRVSKKIRQRLSRIKAIDIEEIDRQLRDRDIDPSTLTEDQIDIQDEPLRAAIKAKADELGLVSVRRACCANAWASQMPCRKSNCLMKDLVGQW